MLKVIGGCGSFWLFSSAVHFSQILTSSELVEKRWTEDDKNLVLFHKANIMGSEGFIGPKVERTFRFRCGFD